MREKGNGISKKNTVKSLVTKVKSGQEIKKLKEIEDADISDNDRKIIEKLMEQKPGVKIRRGFKKELNEKLLVLAREKYSILNGKGGVTLNTTGTVILRRILVSALALFVFIPLLFILIPKKSADNSILRFTPTMEERQYTEKAKQDNLQNPINSNQTNTQQNKVNESQSAAQKPGVPFPSESAATGEATQKNMTFKSSDAGKDKTADTTAVSQTPYNTEEYENVKENNFIATLDMPVTTFSLDIDTASYSNIRRFLTQGYLPDPGAVRIEEMINYFSYDYPNPEKGEVFSINSEYSDCPWNTQHKILLIGIKAKFDEAIKNKRNNFVFLIDVSGSMVDTNKLELAKKSFILLVNNMKSSDIVSIVTYAGSSGVVLEPTKVKDRAKIIDALENLLSGGSTAGAEGIRTAYELAEKNLVKNGNNRIILATDGDFNVGLSSTSELEKIVEKEREKGVFLTVLGFGMGNYKDHKMEVIADKGNGNYAYIDNIMEAEKFLVDDMYKNLYFLAKDVKVQFEFNPKYVEKYRLIGYENRVLDNDEFDDDTVDAGEIGIGHTVTAIYEIIPAGMEENGKDEANDSAQSKDNRYTQTIVKNNLNELFFAKLRYKKLDSDTSILVEKPFEYNYVPLDKTSDNFRFAAAVTEFGLLLEDSKYKGDANYDNVYNLGKTALGEDKYGLRAEFLRLVKIAQKLTKIMTGKSSEED